jgi:hypothetical protein
MSDTMLEQSKRRFRPILFHTTDRAGASDLMTIWNIRARGTP